MRFEDFYEAFELAINYLAERLNPFYRFYGTGSGEIYDPEASRIGKGGLDSNKLKNIEMKHGN